MRAPSFRSVCQYTGQIAAAAADRALIAIGGALDHRIANTAFNPRTSAVTPPAADDPSGGDLAPAFPPGAASPTGHPNVETDEITLHRTELIPFGHGAYLGFSDDFPDRQFLIIPQHK